MKTIDKKKVAEFVKKYASHLSERSGEPVDRQKTILVLLDYARKRLTALAKYNKSPKGERARKRAAKK